METRKPEKIIYLITDLSIGGAQIVLSNILLQLDRREFTPVVVCLFGGDSPIAEKIMKSEIPVIDLQMKNKFDIFAVWRFYKLLMKEKPSILHSSLFHANIISRVIGWLAKIQIIITWRHNINLGNSLREWVNKATSELDDCVVAVSNAVKESEIRSTGVKSEKVIVIYNGIDTNKYPRIANYEKHRTRNKWGIPEDAFLIGSIGRLHPQKGFDLLLHSFERIRRNYPNSWLMIVGEGELRKYLAETAQTLGIFDFTVFTGTITNIPEILGIFDIFVLASRWEGLPLVILEAMTSRLPVIATNVGGVPEVISNNETGFLIQPNDPDAITDRLIRLYNDFEMVNSLGKAGREKIKSDFDIVPITERMQNLYSELLAIKN